MRVSVWTKSNCPQCTMTKKLMEREGIKYEEFNLEENPEQLEKFKAEGLLQAPIVVIGNDGRRFCGFLPEEIKALKRGPLEG